MVEDKEIERAITYMKLINKSIKLDGTLSARFPKYVTMILNKILKERKETKEKEN